MPRIAKNETAEVLSRQIEKYFTHQILSGKLKAGDRLPTNRALAADWSTSCNTVQTALANLVAAGLIERATARGSFVRGQQNRAIIGILVGPSLTTNSGWYYRNLVDALQNEIETEHVSSRAYSGLSFGDSVMLKALKHDEKYLNFIGFIEVATARNLDAIRFGNAPRVVYDGRLPDNCLLFDWEDSSRRIVLKLKEEGIRSAWIASGSTSSYPNQANRLLQQAIGKWHPIPNELVEVVYDASGPNIHPAGFEFWDRRLTEQGIGSLPDALIITDDGILPSLLYALLKHRVKVPKRVKLFTVTTEGSELFSPLPITQFVFPTKEGARILVHLLQEQIRGNPRPSRPLRLKGEFLDAH